MNRGVIEFTNLFVKVTGWLPQRIVFNTKVIYDDRETCSRRIKGPAIIICNHTSIFDYAALLFVFSGRTCRYQMAEVLFNKKGLGVLLRMLGGIRVDRDVYDMGFVSESLDILARGGVVGIFPESRLPRPGEERPLPFKPSAAYIALAAGVPVIPTATNGAYFTLKKRARVVIGAPMDVTQFTKPGADDKENMELVSEALRAQVIKLSEKLDE